MRNTVDHVLCWDSSKRQMYRNWNRSAVEGVELVQIQPGIEMDQKWQFM